MKGNNLLVICHSYNSFQKDQIEELSKYFDHVTVLVRTNPLTEISKFLPLKRYERFTNENKIDLTNKPSNVDVIPTPIVYLPGQNSYKSVGKKHLAAVKKAIKKRQIDFDLIHAHFTWSSGFVGSELKKEFSVPLVVTAHGYDIYSLPFRDDDWRTKIEHVLNSADNIITVSNSNLDCIKKLDVSTPVTVIPNGFRSDLFHPRDQTECRKLIGLPLYKKIILTVGNLVEIKGQKHLIDAIKKIISSRRDILCIIVGSGHLKGALERQISSLGLEQYIRLVGGKPHDEIPFWMNACDLFVLPSLNEGNPTVMFEVLGCGKPFIGTRVGGVPEVITSEDYGILVEPANPEDLADKIIVSLHRDWDQKKILNHASQFTWDSIAKQIVGVYKQVLKENPV